MDITSVGSDAPVADACFGDRNLHGLLSTMHGGAITLLICPTARSHDRNFLLGRAVRRRGSIDRRYDRTAFIHGSRELNKDALQYFT
jgi:hypothetical protein